MVGGFLYQLGGYFLPFVTIGMLLFLAAAVTLCILPRHCQTVQQERPSGNYAKRFNLFYSMTFVGYLNIIRNDASTFSISLNFLLSFDVVHAEDSWNYCVLNFNHGNQRINWISRSNAWATFKAIRIESGFTRWVHFQVLFNELVQKFWFLVYFNCTCSNFSNPLFQVLCSL